MTTSAIIYARYSSAEQGKGFSLERQIGNGRQFIEASGWTLDAILRDEGRSAFSGANRLAGSALHTFEAESRDGKHRGKTLCVENVDRLSRQGAKQAAQLIWSLNECGVDVATWQDGLVYRSDTSGDMMELFSIIIKSQMAHEESLKKSQRTRDSWVKRYALIKEGNTSAIAARTPAWLDVIDGEYRLNARRVSVLNEIFDLYIDGIGIHRIVQTLNNRSEPVWNKVAEKRGGGWYLAYVHRLLTHRAVMGEYVTVSGEIVASDHYPQAVTAEKFNRAQAVRSTKRSTGGGDRTRINNLLSGMVRCAVCGGTAGYENKGAARKVPYTRRDGSITQHARKHYERLRCDGNRRKRGCVNSSLFDYQRVETAVLDATAEALFLPRQDHPELAALRAHLAEKDRQLAVKQSQIGNLIDALANGASIAIVNRIQNLEQSVDSEVRRIATLKKVEALYLSLPEQKDDIASITRLRHSLKSEEYDTRYKARSSTNQALKRLSVDVRLNADGTFLISADGLTTQMCRSDETSGTTRTTVDARDSSPLPVPIDSLRRLLTTLEQG